MYRVAGLFLLEFLSTVGKIDLVCIYVYSVVSEILPTVNTQRLIEL